MANWQSEWAAFFNPDDLSEWLNKPPKQVISIVGSELIMPVDSLTGFIQVLLMKPIADEIALTSSSDGKTMTLRQVLEIMQKNTYKIDRAMKTLRAYNGAYHEHTHDSED